ncbi:uncharacterized protein CC84DRAFT_1210046 [Paraphaeosphaeria sporulosa]|uniref:THUMP domain-containing protein n=1 Tax=Paraphaeosphaeria sporulosa TaxID=1460663 RepID=A0A177BYP3_9PLEO|nr:uncharacterized protein CC84DRAFT_1210046 [Paraphaeosphaeria sporulosa]OAF99751.1 hypothetical protein CC84DRAFT_1210046 [Paraphaeosphaeria sporulosa]
MATDPRKRKAGPDQRDGGNRKKSKGRQKWTVPGGENRGIQPGDTGIWVTCAMNKEAPTVSDLRQLFDKYASQLYDSTLEAEAAEGEDSEASDVDIESEIKKEVEGIRKPKVEPLFKNIKLPGQCLIFFKTRSPVEPVSFLHKICQDTADGNEPQRCRFVKRLTPLSAIGKVAGNGLKDVATEVLAPHFHGPEQTGKKFAIRVNIRNNKQISRDEIIQQVAALVGKGHKVNLSDYDRLILVEVYQSVIGMSVVGPDYDKLKKYNLAELRDNTISGYQKEVADDNTTPEGQKEVKDDNTSKDPDELAVGNASKDQERATHENAVSQDQKELTEI